MTHITEYTLNEYLDDELDAAERTAVESHLAQCANCRETLDDLRLLFTSLEMVRDQPLAVDLGSRVVSQLTPEPGWKWWSVGLVILQAIVAAVMFYFLWPSLRSLLLLGNQAAQAAWLAYQPEPIHFGERLTIWGTAVIAQGPPSFTPVMGQWLIILGLALLLWLVGNKLLLTTTNQQTG